MTLDPVVDPSLEADSKSGWEYEYHDSETEVVSSFSVRRKEADVIVLLSHPRSLLASWPPSSAPTPADESRC